MPDQATRDTKNGIEMNAQWRPKCTYKRCRWDCDKVLSSFPISRLALR